MADFAGLVFLICFLLMSIIVLLFPRGSDVNILAEPPVEKGDTQPVAEWFDDGR